MTDFLSRLHQVSQTPDNFLKLGRGIEREALRYNRDHHLATTKHPEALGSALTNKWITTDFSESLLEFITPVSNDVNQLLSELKDIHHFTLKQMGDENMWPMSMPCFVSEKDTINLAQYGKSNIGKMKTLYRQGLQHRYGSLMQIISGVHFNFSFPDTFWDSLHGVQDDDSRQATKSEGYFGLIRNYYRYGWIIPYLFGASPALCPFFLKGKERHFDFESIGQTLYLPHATSLRLSDLGYTDDAQSDLKISTNGVDAYLDDVHNAMNTPSAEFAKIGVKSGADYCQLNTNILQIENELYAPIRPKRVAEQGEKPSESLARAGVEYIEVRALDINPFSSIGVSEAQVRFLDLFMVWCALQTSTPEKEGDAACWRKNWDSVVIEGRKPGLALKVCSLQEAIPLNTLAHQLFSELRAIAIEMDKAHGGTQYQATCDELEQWVDHPEKTLSGQYLNAVMTSGGIGALGKTLGERHKTSLLAHQYEVYSEAMMKQEAVDSYKSQAMLEQSDKLNFDDFLQDYFSYLAE